jgi:hypothetical protein
VRAAGRPTQTWCGERTDWIKAHLTEAPNVMGGYPAEEATVPVLTKKPFSDVAEFI